MNRTIKEATVKRYHYDSHDELRSHLGNFVDAYNFARRLETLKGLTPYVHLQMLDFRAEKIQPQPAPANVGTKHLVCVHRVVLPDLSILRVADERQSTIS